MYKTEEWGGGEVYWSCLDGVTLFLRYYRNTKTFCLLFFCFRFCSFQYFSVSLSVSFFFFFCYLTATTRRKNKPMKEKPLVIYRTPKGDAFVRWNVSIEFAYYVERVYRLSMQNTFFGCELFTPPKTYPIYGLPGKKAQKCFRTI